VVGSDFLAGITTEDSRVGIGDGYQEIGCGLAIGGRVAHVDEILSGEVGGTVVDHFAIVDDTDFVKGFVEGFSCLVDRHDRADPSDICSDSESSDEFQGCRGV